MVLIFELVSGMVFGMVFELVFILFCNLLTLVYIPHNYQIFETPLTGFEHLRC